jgi:hypothetical protein
MIGPTQKEREQHILEQFRKSIDDFPSGEIRPDERPDFLVGSPPVGIEITELYRQEQEQGQSLKAGESQRNRVVAMAQEIFEKGGGPPIIVYVNFSDNRTLRWSRIEELAECIAERVGALDLSVDVDLNIEDSWLQPRTLPEEISRIAVIRYEKNTQALWAVPGATMVPTMTVEEVQSRIDEKGAKLSEYRTKAEEQWLVIVYDMWISSNYEVPDVVRSHEFITGFDRVYLFRAFGGQAIRLRTAKPEA